MKIKFLIKFLIITVLCCFNHFLYPQFSKKKLNLKLNLSKTDKQKILNQKKKQLLKNIQDRLMQKISSIDLWDYDTKINQIKKRLDDKINHWECEFQWPDSFISNNLSKIDHTYINIDNYFSYFITLNNDEFYSNFCLQFYDIDNEPFLVPLLLLEEQSPEDIKTILETIEKHPEFSHSLIIDMKPNGDCLISEKFSIFIHRLNKNYQNSIKYFIELIKQDKQYRKYWDKSYDKQNTKNNTHDLKISYTNNEKYLIEYVKYNLIFPTTNFFYIFLDTDGGWMMKDIITGVPHLFINLDKNIFKRLECSDNIQSYITFENKNINIGYKSSAIWFDLSLKFHPHNDDLFLMEMFTISNINEVEKKFIMDTLKKNKNLFYGIFIKDNGNNIVIYQTPNALIKNILNLNIPEFFYDYYNYLDCLKIPIVCNPHYIEMKNLKNHTYDPDFNRKYDILQKNFSLLMDSIKKVKNFDKFTENYLNNKDNLLEI